MKLYAVIGGWDYEGEHFDSLKMFESESDAEMYQTDLADSYDYAYMKELQTV